MEMVKTIPNKKIIPPSLPMIPAIADKPKNGQKLVFTVWMLF
jgi:hypothetical protein